MIAGARNTGHNGSVAPAKSPRVHKMSQAHKEALAAGRDQSRIVKRYLEALERARTERRAHVVSQEALRRQLEEVERSLNSADPLGRLLLLQRRKDLTAALLKHEELARLADLEEAFVQVAASYARRKGIAFETWREARVSPSVLRRAGILPTRRHARRAHPPAEPRAQDVPERA